MTRTRLQQRRNEQQQNNRRAPMFKPTKNHCRNCGFKYPDPGGAENCSAAKSTCRYCKTKGHFERVCGKKRQITMVVMVKTEAQKRHHYHDLANGTVINRKDWRTVHRSMSEKVNLHVASTMKIKTMFIMHPTRKQKCCQFEIIIAGSPVTVTADTGST